MLDQECPAKKITIIGAYNAKSQIKSADNELEVSVPCGPQK